MKRLLLLSLTILLSLQCIGQVTFMINDFSDEYYGKLYIADTSVVFSEGWVAVYNKKNNKELLKIESEELTFTIHDGKVQANIAEAPYGEQSVLIYDDFNFDGKEDFALMNGQNSCYHGPSFNIYLFDNGKFTYSESFSELSNMYCGMFQSDPTEKRIYTMTKSGCCWHQYSEYIVENNEPKAVRIEEYNHYALHPYLLVITEQKWDGTKMVTTVIGKEIDLSSVSESDLIPFSFQLENGKWVLFIDDISAEEDKVSTRYAFVDAEGKVELEYPNPDENRKFANFIYTEKGDNYTCSFSNGNAKYMVYDYSTPQRKVGVKVVVNGKTYDLKGKPETVTRKLRVIAECDNVTEQ